MEIEKVIEQHYAKQLAYATQVHQAASKLVESYLTPLVLKSDDKYHKIALLMLMRACQSLLSARLLFAAGLETDAMSVTRTIAELVIDFEWMTKKPGKTKARMDLYWEYSYMLAEKRDELTRLGFKSDEEFEAHMRAFWEAMPAEVRPGNTYGEYRTEALADRDRVRGNYDKHGSWSSKAEHPTIWKRAKNVGLEKRVYKLAYALGCEASHSNAGGISNTQSPGQQLPVEPLTLLWGSECLLHLCGRVARFIYGAAPIPDDVSELMPGDQAKAMAEVFGLGLKPTFPNEN